MAASFRRSSGSGIPRFLPTALIVLAMTAPVTANTFVVTKTADTNDGTCDADCSLREAIVAANGHMGADDITLPAGTYTLTIAGAGEDAGATGDLDITTDDLTINGAGAATTIVDGGGLDRVFNTIGVISVVFNDMTIRNGNGGALAGGGIRASGPLTLNNCVVTSNTDAGQGGGIFGGTLTLNSTTISDNSSTGDQGGGLFVGGTTNIMNSRITGNTAFDEGGGIFVEGGSSPQNFNITDSTISNNASGSAGGGGGIFILSEATVTISRCTITGNTTESFGGAGILNEGATLVLTSSTVNGNTAAVGTQGGGGLLNDGSGAVATVTSSTIDANSAPLGSGGGILSKAGAITIVDTIVANNTGGNCSGTVADGGTNLQFPGTTCGGTIPTADPLLQGLADNGGPTQTQSLSNGSPAIDAGTTGCPPTPATDQRGVSRPQGAACDIGAFECQNGECGAVTAASADLAVTKTASPNPVAPGANLTYSIEATNAGPSAASNVSLSDTLPSGTTFVSFTVPAGWSATTPAVGGPGTVTATISSLASGAHASFTLVVQVDSGAAGGTLIKNTVAVSSQTSDPNGANDSASFRVTVSTGGPAAPIPMLSGWATTVLVSLLALAGVVGVFRRVS